MRPDVEAEVTFIPTEAGGRKSPVRPGYRGQLYYDGRDWDAVYQFPAERANPGDTVRAVITLMSPEHHIGKLHPGKLILIREGTKTVAYGQIMRLLELEAPPPGQ